MLVSSALMWVVIEKHLVFQYCDVLVQRVVDGYRPMAQEEFDKHLGWILEVFQCGLKQWVEAALATLWQQRLVGVDGKKHLCWHFHLHNVVNTNISPEQQTFLFLNGQ